MPLPATAAVCLLLGLTQKTSLDADATHDGHSVHTQHGSIGIGLHRHPLDVPETSHDRGSGHLDG